MGCLRHKDGARSMSTTPQDWTQEEAEALSRLPHDERLRMRLEAQTGSQRSEDTDRRSREPNKEGTER